MIFEIGSGARAGFRSGAGTPHRWLKSPLGPVRSLGSSIKPEMQDARRGPIRLAQTLNLRELFAKETLEAFKI